MNDEKRRPGRPPRAITGAETLSQEWKNPPLQGDVEEQVETHISMAQEFPVEQKIRQLVESECPAGWYPIEYAPKDGNRIVVSETGDDQLSVFWRIRRIVDKKNLRYVKEGKWTDMLSRMDINFDPKYCRPYVATDYIPWPRKA